jgi:hypothetical protein
MNVSAFAPDLGGRARSAPLLAGGRALVYRNKPGRVTSSHVQFVSGDLPDPDSLDHAAKGCQIVCHLAWRPQR